MNVTIIVAPFIFAFDLSMFSITKAKTPNFYKLKMVF